MEAKSEQTEKVILRVRVSPKKKDFMFPPLKFFSGNVNAHENVLVKDHDLKVGLLLLWYGVMIMTY